MAKKKTLLRYDALTDTESAHGTRRKRLVRETERVNRVAISRQRDFEQIATAIEPHHLLSASLALVAQGDSLTMLRKLPRHSVSLILTDPPYHATKKQNIYGDRAFAEDQHYLDWMANYATEWHRVLRPNGSLFASATLQWQADSKSCSRRVLTSFRMWFGQSQTIQDSTGGKVR